MPQVEAVEATFPRPEVLALPGCVVTEKDGTATKTMYFVAQCASRFGRGRAVSGSVDPVGIIG